MIFELPSATSFAKRQRSRWPCSPWDKFFCIFMLVVFVVLYALFVGPMLSGLPTLGAMTIHGVVIFVVAVLFAFVLYGLEYEDTQYGRHCFEPDHDLLVLICNSPGDIKTAVEQLYNHTLEERFYGRTTLIGAPETLVTEVEAELSMRRTIGWRYTVTQRRVSIRFDMLYSDLLCNTNPTKEVCNYLNGTLLEIIELHLPRYHWSLALRCHAPLEMRHMVEVITCCRAYAHTSSLQLLSNELLFRLFECL